MHEKPSNFRNRKTAVVISSDNEDYCWEEFSTTLDITRATEELEKSGRRIVFATTSSRKAKKFIHSLSATLRESRFG